MDNNKFLRLNKVDYKEILKGIYDKQIIEIDNSFKVVLKIRKESFCQKKCSGQNSDFIECQSKCIEIYDTINDLNLQIQNKIFYDRIIPITEMLSNDFEKFKNSHNI